MGLSKSVSLHVSRGHVCYTRTLRAGKQADRLRNIDEQRAAALQGLPVEDQEAID
ncbi:hypothetical protein SCLCIDRAFT_1217525 [Scleroderma citrinum Foug A]|uniref:Uncharacterized protein n=1 Tax=Scleroderma citrinum Foug A TaxID=1036808 RepID=A0A0C3DTR7_9AGAM|nr:hypothetical protein SCLCIDRAFT_1217525 [Scleroderma citrinum Foug A]